MRRLATWGFWLCAVCANAQHLEVSEGFLVWQDTKEPFVIVEANSPENKLAQLSYSSLDQLIGMGVNTIYATVFGGDDTSICMWFDCNDRDTINSAKVATWRSFFQYWAFTGNPDRPRVIHIVLTEAENDEILSDTERYQMYDAAMAAFGDLPVIWLLGEEIGNPIRDIRPFAQYFQANDPFNSPVALHNIPHQEPWRAFRGEGIIDLVAFQIKNLDDVDPRVGDQWRYMNDGDNVAVYVSEVGPSSVGNPSDSSSWCRSNKRRSFSSNLVKNIIEYNWLRPSKIYNITPLLNSNQGYIKNEAHQLKSFGNQS